MSRCFTPLSTNAALICRGVIITVKSFAELTAQIIGNPLPVVNTKFSISSNPLPTNEMTSVPTLGEIGGWLKSVRKRQDKYSQEQAAPKVRTTTRTLAGWERGETAPPIDQFFELVALYEAWDALVNQLTTWRNASGEVVADTEDAGGHDQEVPRQNGKGGEVRVGATADHPGARLSSGIPARDVVGPAEESEPEKRPARRKAAGRGRAG